MADQQLHRRRQPCAHQRGEVALHGDVGAVLPSLRNGAGFIIGVKLPALLPFTRTVASSSDLVIPPRTSA